MQIPPQRATKRNLSMAEVLKDPSQESADGPFEVSAEFPGGAPEGPPRVPTDLDRGAFGEQLRECPLEGPPESCVRAHEESTENPTGGLLARQWKVQSEECQEPRVPSEAPTSRPLLVLPWRCFNFNFDGDFSVGGLPVLLPTGGPWRPPEEQCNGDTGCSVWDAAVVLTQYVEEKLESLFKTLKVHPSWEHSGGPQGDIPEDSLPLFIELGAGKGLVGLGVAAALTALVTKKAQGSPEIMEKVPYSGASRTLPRPSRCGCRVLLTDLDYCLGGLRAAVKLNGHFAELVDLSNNTQDISVQNGPSGGASAVGARHGPGGGPLAGSREGPPGHRVRVAVEALDWFCPDQCVAWGPSRAPPLQNLLVVAADVLWLRELVEPFVQTLAFLFSNSKRDNNVVDNAAPRPLKHFPPGLPEGLASRQGHLAEPQYGLPGGPAGNLPGDSSPLEEDQLCFPFCLLAHQSRSTAVDNLFFALLKKYGLYASALRYGASSGGPKGAPLGTSGGEILSRRATNSIQVYAIQQMPQQGSFFKA